MELEWKRVGFIGREGLRDEYRPNRFLALNDSRSSGLEIWWRGARHYDGLRFLPDYRRDDAAVLEPHHILAESERSAAVYQEPVPDLDPCGLQWTLLAGQRSALFGAIDDVELYSCICWGVAQAILQLQVINSIMWPSNYKKLGTTG